MKAPDVIAKRAGGQTHEHNWEAPLDGGIEPQSLESADGSVSMTVTKTHAKARSRSAAEIAQALAVCISLHLVNFSLVNLTYVSVIGLGALAINTYMVSVATVLCVRVTPLIIVPTDYVLRL